MRLSITDFHDFPAISPVRMISGLYFPAFVSQSVMIFEESIVASEYLCGFSPRWLLRNEAAGLDVPAAAAAGVFYRRVARRFSKEVLCR